ncbi:MAG TPA: glycosyltransferase, partial [Acidimicrobiales bacterium]|nr:glycosyltransferase [Acidimicrobiales bacterium]
RGIRRHLTISNLVAIAGLGVAFIRAVVIVGVRRPAVVLSVGGYGGVACALAARLWRIPVVTLNVDAVVGAANRLIGRFAERSLVAFEGTAIPRAVVTGVPVREEILAVDRSEPARVAARAALGVGAGRKLIVFVGGSLGARRINEVAVGLRDRYSDRSDLAFRHICGAREHERLVSQARFITVDSSDTGLEYRLVRYEEKMSDVLCAADVLVGRAGAMTVAELRVIGLPAILVPLPGAPGDHQTKNAEALASLGGAVVVPDADATPERLAHEIDAILADDRVAEAMGRAAKAEGSRDAAGVIAKIIDGIAAHRGERS